jgi:hypothetical protein
MIDIYKALFSEEQKAFLKELKEKVTEIEKTNVVAVEAPEITDPELRQHQIYRCLEGKRKSTT